MANQIINEKWKNVTDGIDYGKLYSFLAKSEETKAVIEKNCHISNHKTSRQTLEQVFVFNSLDIIPSIFGITQQSALVWRSATQKAEDKRRMRAVHSSALLAFLCFSDISNAPLLLSCSDGVKRKFDESHLEWPDRAIDPNWPSMLDVLLLTEDKKHALALECKFGEYLSNNPGGSSLKKYMDRIGLAEEFRAIEKLATLNGDYLEIAKQIFAHAYGLSNFYKIPKKDTLEPDPGRLKTFNDLQTIDYAEMVFDFGEVAVNRLNDFRSLYKEIAKRINGINLQAEANPKGRAVSISLLPELLTYQKIFRFENLSVLPKMVRTFYRFDD